MAPSSPLEVPKLLWADYHSGPNLMPGQLRNSELPANAISISGFLWRTIEASISPIKPDRYLHHAISYSDDAFGDCTCWSRCTGPSIGRSTSMAAKIEWPQSTL